MDQERKEKLLLELGDSIWGVITNFEKTHPDVVVTEVNLSRGVSSEEELQIHPEIEDFTRFWSREN